MTDPTPLPADDSALVAEASLHADDGFGRCDTCVALVDWPCLTARLASRLRTVGAERDELQWQNKMMSDSFDLVITRHVKDPHAQASLRCELDEYTSALAVPHPDTERLDVIRSLVADDTYAITFQTMGQYRTALLRAFREDTHK